jgi:hypothetical protein
MKGVKTWLMITRRSHCESSHFFNLSLSSVLPWGQTCVTVDNRLHISEESANLITRWQVKDGGSTALKALWAVFLGVGAALAAQDVPPDVNLLLRHYHEGEHLTYRVKGVPDWHGHDEVQADGIVKKDPDGTYFEEYEWSAPSDQGVAVRQQISLDPNGKLALPSFTDADLWLSYPMVQMWGIYIEVRLAVKGKLTRAGDHFHFSFGGPASCLVGKQIPVTNLSKCGDDVLLAQFANDFDYTLKDVNRANDTATLVVRHVAPEIPDVKLPAEWMRKPVAGTPNNEVVVRKTGEGTYLTAVGKTTQTDEIVLSLSDGKILSATLDNPGEVVERECADSALTQCGEPQSRSVRARVEISLEH